MSRTVVVTVSCDWCLVAAAVEAAPTSQDQAQGPAGVLPPGWRVRTFQAGQISERGELCPTCQAAFDRGLDACLDVMRAAKAARRAEATEESA